MTRASSRVRLELSSLTRGLLTRAFAARVLLLALATLLTAMPYTERLVSWDRVFHGGQDVEFGLLAIGVAFGLSFLVVQHFALSPPLGLAICHCSRDTPRAVAARLTLGHLAGSDARTPQTLLRI